MRKITEQQIRDRSERVIVLVDLRANMACKYTLETLKNAVAACKHDDMEVSEAAKSFSVPKVLCMTT